MISLIIILNVVLATFVVVGIVGIHLYAIAKSRSDEVATSERGTAAARAMTTGRGRSRSDRRMVVVGADPATSGSLS